jgi:hypothetical protein
MAKVTTATSAAIAKASHDVRAWQSSQQVPGTIEVDHPSTFLSLIVTPEGVNQAR